MLTQKDLSKLKGVHRDLVSLVHLMAMHGPMPFMVLEGVRTLETQQANVASGASQTMNSRHLTGHAVDLAPLLPDGSIPWDEWSYWEAFALHMKGASSLTGIPVLWGGDWTTLVDGPHWELPWSVYPIEVPAEEPIAI